ncbi:SIR2 family protein [Nocardioides sp. CPCC 205120]|uniref:SIR2 family protein n=1 Tax=Nocardioides sp. CPCC 205120 TaxID=3406462 RepID=UPI003B5001BB
MHGDVAHPSTIVLTRRHMVRYDAAFRPSGALLQSLLLTRNLLVVGTSMTDDNVIRLLHEVEVYRQEHHEGRSGTFGTVLDTDGDKVRAQLWKGQLEWLFMGDAAPEVSGYRGVELFLDRVALHGSRDSSWALDERFAGRSTRATRPSPASSERRPPTSRRGAAASGTPRSSG